MGIENSIFALWSQNSEDVDCWFLWRFPTNIDNALFLFIKVKFNYISVWDGWHGYKMENVTGKDSELQNKGSEKFRLMFTWSNLFKWS